MPRCLGDALGMLLASQVKSRDEGAKSCLDVEREQVKSGARLIQWPCHKTKWNQLYTFTADGSVYINIPFNQHRDQRMCLQAISAAHAAAGIKDGKGAPSGAAAVMAARALEERGGGGASGGGSSADFGLELAACDAGEPRQRFQVHHTAGASAGASSGEAASQTAQVSAGTVGAADGRGKNGGRAGPAAAAAAGSMANLGAAASGASISSAAAAAAAVGRHNGAFDVVFRTSRLGLNLDMDPGLSPAALPVVRSFTGNAATAAAAAGAPLPRAGDVLLAVNGAPLEGEADARAAAIRRIGDAPRPLTLTFRPKATA